MPTTPRRPAKKPRSSYHHGDLRAALIAAAKAEVERVGADEVSLKALATELRVSSPAPYRHFADREALLAAVAGEGFRDFTSVLAGAQSLEDMAQAYVDFGRTHIGLYRLMFISPALAHSEPGSEIRTQARKAFELLFEAVARIVSEPRTRLVAFGVWSSLHGLVMLEDVGFLGGPIAEGLDPRALVRAACTLATSGS